MSEIRRCLSYDDVLLVPRYSGNEHLKDADIECSYIGIPNHFKSYPIINSPMDTVCSPSMCEHLLKNNYPITIHRYFKGPQEQLDFVNLIPNVRNFYNRTFIAVGSVYKWKDWIDYLMDKSSFALLVDMAQGDSKTCIETVEYIRSKDPYCNIMAGNVATRSGFGRLAKAGANFIRAGIGGGSICATRVNVAFGVPTLTSVMDCASVKGDNVYLIADGGINKSGDIVKALHAGADMVMVGKILAGTSLSPGAKYDRNMNFTEDLDEAKYVEYRGMASHKAQQSLDNSKIHSIEGVSGVIPYIGTTEFVLESTLQNLRSAMSYYAGCRNWNEFKRMVKMIEITSAGISESGTGSILKV